LTFENRSVKTVREFCFQLDKESFLTERDCNKLREMIAKAFEDQHHASMEQLAEYMVEKFKIPMS
jgi:hypothetical protein